MLNKIHDTIIPFIEMSGYEPKTTFWDDFGIAEICSGDNGVRDTFNRAFKEWQSNTEYVTELVLVLNWKMWYWADENEKRARLYEELWGIADKWCMDNLKDKDLEYFLSITD